MVNENELKPNRTIAVYARVSSSNQENEGTIETQLSAIHDYAAKNNYTIIQEYLDNGWSGDNIVRPELDKLRVDAKKKIWDTVLIYDPDRLARRYSYQELILDELREGGITVLFVTTPPPTNSIEKILYGVQGLFAEYERAKIAERFRLGKIRKAREGHVITTEGPYGYTFIPKQGKRGEPEFKQGYYSINDYEAEVTKSIFKWVGDDGLTIRAVIKKLQSLGIQPRKSKKGVWSTSTLCSLLRNKTYIGEGHYGATYAVVPEKPVKKDNYRKIKKSSRKIRPEEDWIKIPTPRLIEDSLFYRVKEKLQKNFDSSLRNTKNEYLLTGKIWCICGRRRTGEGALHGKHLYYRCTDRVLSYPLVHTCIEKGINARITDSLVWKNISKLMTSPELLTTQAESWLKNKKANPSARPINVEVLSTELKKLRDQEGRYTKAFGEGLITIEKLKEYLGPVRERQALLEKQINEEKKQEQSAEETPIPGIEEIKAFTEKAALVIRSLNFEAKKAIIKEVIDKVTATQKKLSIYGYIPVSSLNNVSLCSEYRNSQNIIQQNSKYSVPFILHIQLPPPLRRGIDYGFRPVRR